MSPLHLRGCTIDLEAGRLDRAGTTERLSLTERRLLTWLLAHPGRVISRQELLREVWHWQARRATRAVDVAVRRLRDRIEVDPRRPDHLFTIHGVGYRFVPLRVENPRATAAGDTALLARIRAADTQAGPVLIDAPARSGGTRLALQLLDVPEGRAVYVDLNGVDARLTAWVLGLALVPGVPGDEGTIVRMIRAAGPLRLVVDHAEDAHVARFTAWHAAVPNLQVHVFGRGLTGARIQLPAPTQPRPLPATDAALTRLATPRGPLEEALLRAWVADDDAFALHDARGLVDRRAGTPRVPPSVRDAAGAEDAAWATWLRRTLTDTLRRYHRQELPVDALRAIRLLPHLWRTLADTEGWSLAADVAELARAPALRRVALIEAVSSAQGDVARDVARLRLERVSGTEPRFVPTTDAPEVTDWAAITRAEGHRQAFDLPALRTEIDAVLAASERLARPDLARSLLRDAATANEWFGDQGHSGRMLALLNAHCDHHDYPFRSARLGATELLWRAQHDLDADFDAQLDALLSDLRSPALGVPPPAELLRLAALLQMAERDAEALALLAEALDAAVRQGRVETELAARNNLGFADVLDARWGRAAQRFAEARSVASAADSPIYEGAILLNTAAMLEDDAVWHAASAKLDATPNMRDTALRRWPAMPGAVDDPDGAQARAAAGCHTAAHRREVEIWGAILALRRGDRGPAEAVAARTGRLDVASRFARAHVLRALRRA